MESTPNTRKTIRLKDFDYSSAGVYFVTVCSKDRKPNFWYPVGADNIRPDAVPLSPLGVIIDTSIRQISHHYPHISVDKYCIMPDHIHLLIHISADEQGRQIGSNTLSTVVGQMKRWVSKQAGFPVWQKSFIDRIIRNERGYLAVWSYIDNNPIQMDSGDDLLDFSEL